MANLQLKYHCLFCKQCLTRQTSFWNLYCPDCRRAVPPEGEAHPVNDASAFIIYLDNKNNVTEISVHFPDGLGINAAWGKDFNKIIFIQKYSETIQTIKNVAFPYRPDADYIYKKNKMMLTFS